MKENKKAARKVQKEPRAMQTPVRQCKTKRMNNLQDVIKAITDDIEYKDAFCECKTIFFLASHAFLCFLP